MRPLRDCLKYQPEIKRLTKSNSTLIDGRVVYVTKKDNEGKSIKIYMAYDYKTRIQLGGHSDKEFLIDFLSKQDLKVLNELDV